MHEPVLAVVLAAVLAVPVLPVRHQPDVRPVAERAASPVRPVDGPRGVATWFRAPASTAAAGPALRAWLGRGWRGQRVRVCAASGCVVVRLTDWCACGHGRVIDLGADSFARLAPLSRGVLRVTVGRV